MKAVGIIPARYGSTRFPGKPLAMIAGKTMIRRVYEQAIQALSDVCVATDDKRIMNEVRSWGGRVLMTSPTHKCGTDRCAEVAKQMSLGDDDIVINIQGDEPMMNPDFISLLVSVTKRYGNDEIVTLASDVIRRGDYTNPNRVKVIRDMRGCAEAFNRKKIQVYHKDNYIHIGIYAYRVKTLFELVALPPLPLKDYLEQIRWMYAGYKIRVLVVSYDGISVDTPEDLIKVNKYVSK